MKKCYRCKKEKLVECFGKNKSTIDGLQNRCKTCRSDHNKKWYTLNSTLQKSRTRDRREHFRDSLKLLIIETLLKSSCLDCGETNIVVLDFDHKKDKQFNVSSAPRLCISIEKLKAEIEKCEIRCANCHRIKTAKENNSYKYKKYLELIS